MNKVIGIIISIILFITNTSQGQTAEINGQVFDAKTKEPLESVTIKSGQNGTTTDHEGKFTLKIVPGDHKVEVSIVGYESKTFKVPLINGEIVTLMVDLDETSTYLQTTIVTAGKYEAPLSESTVSMEVIKPALIESNNITSAEQILNKIPSVNVLDGQANIRGGSGFAYGVGSRVLLLVDDLPAFQIDAGLPNWGDIGIENIEQIEVIKGAASALYGSAAMNGIINVRTGYAKSKPITKAAIFSNMILSPKDESKKWWSSTPVEYGASILHKQKFEKIDLVLAAFGITGDQYIKDTYNRYVRLSPGIRYRISDKLSIGLNTNINKGNSKSFFLWKDGKENAYVGDSTTATITDKLRYTLDPFLTYFDNSGNRHKFLGRYHYIDNENNNNQSNKSSLYYAEYQFQRNFSKAMLILTAGVSESYSNVTAELYGNAKYSIENQAIYLQADKKFGDRFTLSVGARYEFNTITNPDIINIDTIAAAKNRESKPVLRIGTNYKLTEATFLRASWGQGYRFPTIAEKFIRTNFGIFPILPNPGLKSETGWTGEVGIKQAFKISDWYGFADISGFWSEYTDMMEFTFLPLPGFQSLNVGNTIIKGGEFSIGADGSLFGLSTSLLAGYTYIDPKFKNFGPAEKISSSADYNILKYRFKHSIKFDAETHYFGFSLGVSCNYNSNMEAIDRVFYYFIKGVQDFSKTHNKGYTLVGLRLGYSFRSFKASVLINNLLNEEYALRPAQLEAPRTLAFRVEFNLN